MCGICGTLSFTQPPDIGFVEAACHELQHRGPDAQGVWASGPVVLGHRRLSVIDLSAIANQPLKSHDGRLAVTFNGEIYNFQDLRKELVSNGARFISSSDTEVILHAYELWGIDFVTRLNGMFAIGLWDVNNQTLLLARDRLGEKPLFYLEHPDGGITFTSSLDSIRQHSQFSGNLDEKGLREYLSLGYTLTPTTLLEGVKKLPAGHTLIAKRGTKATIRCFWNLAEKAHQNLEVSAARATEQLTSLLDDAVRLRRVSDVPLGCFLSGGLDSSSVLASMLQCGPAPETFTIRFNEATYDESGDAIFLAQILRCANTSTTAAAPTPEQVVTLVKRCGEPLGDSSLLPMAMLAQLARSKVVVSLSGDGADELFGGYSTYVADTLRRWTNWIPQFVLRTILGTYTAITPANFGKISFDYKLRRFLSGIHLPEVWAHYHWRELFSCHEIGLLTGSAAPPFPPGLEVFEKYANEMLDADPLKRLLYIDVKTWLADDILVKLDRATMAYSLEGRVPFLDHRLVEFAFQIPSIYKFSRLTGKQILRKSQAQRLPARTIVKKKSGFNSPVSVWILDSLAPLIHEMIYQQSRAGVLDAGYIKQLYDEHRQRKADNGLRLFNLLMFHIWNSKALY